MRGGMFPERLQAARLRLVRARPYLAAALWALVPVERPGLGTLAVDRWWRLYFDPAVCSAWTVEQLAGVLYHEVCHLLRAHHERAEVVGAEPGPWNTCADAEINDDLRAEKVALPGQPIFPEVIGLPEGKLAEEYYSAYSALRQAGEGEAGPDGSSRGDAGETAQVTAPSQPGAGREGDGADSSATAQGGSQTDGTQPEGGGDASGSQPGDVPDSQPGDAGDPHQPGDSGGSQPSPSSGQSPAASGRSGAPSQPPAGPVGDRRAGGTGGTPSGAGAQTPAPGAGRCGSCATGQPEPWEEPPPDRSVVPGVSAAEAELIRREVARQILEASRDRGEVPGHWRRWAEEKLSPKVDWRRELASAVRSAVAQASLAADYTFRRPSRRSVPGVILPGLWQPLPEVAVVVDTSGSMSDRQVAQALAEVAGVLRALGNRTAVRVLAVDAAVQTCQRVFRPEQVELAGGGGTDMRVGLEAAVRLRPRPDVVVVVTDGHTPWPERPPEGVRVIVALVGDGEAPAWAKAVKVEV